VTPYQQTAFDPESLIQLDLLVVLVILHQLAETRHVLVG
jgi:hypothetical protein